MTLDNLSRLEIEAALNTARVSEEIVSLRLTHAALFEALNTPPKKQGRQGYALILFRDYLGYWNWTIETQNGIEVAHSARPSSRRWSAVRSAKRLSDNISNVYIEDETGTRTEA